MLVSSNLPVLIVLGVVGICILFFVINQQRRRRVREQEFASKSSPVLSYDNDDLSVEDTIVVAETGIERENLFVGSTQHVVDSQKSNKRKKKSKSYFDDDDDDDSFIEEIIFDSDEDDDYDIEETEDENLIDES